MFDHYEQAAKSLRELLRKSTAHEQGVRQKVLLMQRIYLGRRGGMDTKIITNLDLLLDQALDKFYKSTFIHEHIWALSHADRSRWVEVLNHQDASIACDAMTEQMVQVYFECLLLEARTFLAFYMNYLCYFLSEGRIDKKFGLQLNDFAKGIKKLNAEGNQKANIIEEYFLNNVMDIYIEGKAAKTSHWGDLLKSLRDKITHYKLLTFGRNGTEKIGMGGRVRFDWPTIQGRTIDRFGQEITNGMFELLMDVSPVLYELEWKSGHYRSDLWDDQK